MFRAGCLCPTRRTRTEAGVRSDGRVSARPSGRSGCRRFAAVGRAVLPDDLAHGPFHGECSVRSGPPTCRPWRPARRGRGSRPGSVDLAPLRRGATDVGVDAARRVSDHGDHRSRSARCGASCRRFGRDRAAGLADPCSDARNCIGLVAVRRDTGCGSALRSPVQRTRPAGGDRGDAARTRAALAAAAPSPQPRRPGERDQTPDMGVSLSHVAVTPRRFACSKPARWGTIIDNADCASTVLIVASATLAEWTGSSCPQRPASWSACCWARRPFSG